MPSTRIHTFICIDVTYHLPTVTSPPSPPSTRFWRRYARRMAGFRRSAPTQPRREHSALLRGRTPSFPSPLSPSPYLRRSLPPSFPLPPLTFPPAIEFAGVLEVVLVYWNQPRHCYPHSRLAHTVQYVIENWEEPGNEAGYYTFMPATETAFSIFKL